MGAKSRLTEPILDLDSALARLGGDRELFADMAGYLYEDAPQLLNKLQTGIDQGDSTSVRMSAHALKGLLASAGGVRSVGVAQELEDAAVCGDLSNVRELLESLESEFAELKASLAPHTRSV